MMIDDLESFKEGNCTPANTVNNNEWALWTFETWRAARNIKYTTDQRPSNKRKPPSNMQMALVKDKLLIVGFRINNQNMAFISRNTLMYLSDMSLECRRHQI